MKKLRDILRHAYACKDDPDMEYFDINMAEKEINKHYISRERCKEIIENAFKLQHHIINTFDERELIDCYRKELVSEIEKENKEAQ